MAYNGSWTGVYSGRPNYDIFLAVRRDQTDNANNRSSYYWELYARNPTGSTTSWNGDPGPWAVRVGDLYQGTHNLDFRGGQASILLASGYTNWYTHDPEGYITVNVAANHSLGQFGTANTGAQFFYADRIAKRPAANYQPSVDAVNPTTARVNWVNPPDWRGGQPWGFQIQYATNAAFTQNVNLIGGLSSTPYTLTNLSPGTTYYVRVRSYNSSTWDNGGIGDFSPATSFTTTAAVPPGQVVTASPSGTSATVALTPPSGGSGVVSYTIERRVVGDTVTVPITTTTVSTVVSGLTPGTTYEWRSRANYSSSSSPWSSWEPVTQPKPNVSAGDYFDGSSTDTDDVDFSWVGTANNSVSLATGKEPLGWAASTLTGSALIQRVVGGRAPAAWGSRVLVTADATDVRAGMAPETGYWSDVEPNSQYVGSIYVRTPQATALVPEIEWYDAAGDLISRSAGTLVDLPADPESWVRLVVTAMSPELVSHAAVVAKALILTAGSTFYLDDMMLTLSSVFPFFSGATPDDAQFTYEWLGDPYSSVSSRTANLGEGPDPLIDPDCDPVPAPPRPPTVPDPCIIETGVWRRYWLSIPPSEVSDWLTMLPTITLTTGPYDARQVRIRVYPNAANQQPSDMDQDAWCSEQIISYIPANTEMVLDGVTERAWATVDNETRPADHLLYGTGGSPATWSELSCGIGHLVSFDVPLDSPEGSVSPVISLTRRAR